jgi:hypothetical protein
MKHKAKNPKTKASDETAENLEDMQEQELTGAQKDFDLEESETDEDESEGLGDGNLGKDEPNLLDK